MIRIVSFALFVSILAGLFVATERGLLSSVPEEQDRKQLWTDSQLDQSRGLPKSAIEKLKAIRKSAVADEAWSEATLAMCSQFLLEGQIDQPVYPHVIKKLQAAIPESPQQMKPVLNVMLAEYIYLYYSQNSWRFQQRSQTQSAPGDDIEAWDLARILGEVDKHFTTALEAADELKKIPIGDYEMLLEKGTVSDRYRPTLYDFVAFRALSFYSLDEQFIRQQDAFEVSADGPIFSSTKEFLNWKPDTTDEDSYRLRAVTLLQEVLRYHADDDENSAFLDAELMRFRFGRSVATGSESGARYRAALQRFSDDHADHPISTVALAALAMSIQSDEKDLVKARKIAQQGPARFPASIGAKQCRNVTQQIETKSIQISTERVWNGDEVTVDVRYRNTSKIWFRLVKFDFQNWKQWAQRQSPSNFSGDEFTQLLKLPIAKQWSVDLPETKDFQERTESVLVAPDNLKLDSGCYVLLSCSNDEFVEGVNGEFNSISVAEVWISKLAAIVRRGVGENQFEVQVFDAISGLPIRNATVDKVAWKYEGRKSFETDRQRAQTDQNGMAKLKYLDRNNMVKLQIQSGDQTLGIVDRIYGGRYRNRTTQLQTVFFTDRSIYRPGQTIQFKGICYRANTMTNKYSTLIGKKVTVWLFDANNQEVEKKDFTANEFGSFSGSFTAPRNRATGVMRIQCSVNGNTSIRVEEYKRPKFFAEIDKPAEAFQLGKQVTVKGKATAYTGAAIDGAKVTWRVVRTVRYPSWWRSRFWYRPMQNNSQEMANGELKTDIEGKFEVTFTAEPDNSVDRASEPVFTYQIFADVTDTAGETRSASQTTSIGYTSLEANLSAEDWLTTDEDVSLSLKVSTLDGEGQSAKGKLKIYQLTPPERVARANLGRQYRWGYNPDQDKPDFSKINAWPTGAVLQEMDVATDDSGKAEANVRLDAGAFKAVFETTDSSGNLVKTELPLMVNDVTGDKFAIRIPHHFQQKTKSVEPGEEFVAIWGTGYDSGRAFIEISHRGKTIKSWWTGAESTQHVIKFPIEEKHRGGLQMRISYVRENRNYSQRHSINVPWTNKKLAVKWEHFVSKLQPGGRETWTAVVTGPDAESAVAEMVVGMYDASLDAFAAHRWRDAFNVFYRDRSPVSLKFYNYDQFGRIIVNKTNFSYEDATRSYRKFDQRTGLYQSVDYWSGGISRGGYFGRSFGAMGRGGGYGSRSQMGFGGGGLGASGGMEMAENEMAADFAAPAPSSRMTKSAVSAKKPGSGPGGSASASSGVDLKQVSPRKNLQETAFFFPHLAVDDDGSVRMEFEIPEALTKWKFMGFAHDNELRAALLTDEMTTSKDLMVQPNPPRFLREGDLLEFSVKVSNQSDDPQSGSVRLTFADARTAKSVDAAFGNQQLDQAFEIPAKQSKSLYWKIKVPDFVGALTYKAVGATEKVSDGEEGFLPVLSKRILVTESLPLPIRGNQTKTFDFERLKLAGKSDTLQSQTLTIQMTSNPSWYAVMSLPYLMEYPHECSEQTFNRLYANSLGQHIVSSDPKIERIFEQWRGTDAVDSPLEKNEDLRNVLIAESPWLQAGKKESQARRDVGILFDKNRMTNEIQRAADKLTQMQLSDGAWPWFPGGRANDYITLYVTTGFGRLRQLGTEVDVAPALKALDRLDWWINNRYEDIKRRGDLEKNNLSQTVCLYLYGRSFFLKDKPVDDNYKSAFDYFVGQGKKHWVTLNNRQSQGHLAIALKRIGDRETPTAIMASLTERSLQDDEMGMFWREGDRSWWWYKAPIETQALMIEAYDEVARDKEKVEELKIWLLKQKQTQNWKTTKATADACYGLLLRGTNLLASDKLVTVKLGSMEIKPEKVEAGTGFYEQKFVRSEIKPEMGQIELTKPDDGIAWGSVHWQYLEDVSKIEPYEGTPLTLKKSLYIKKNTEKGPVISEVDGPVEVGDELVMRVELRVDRAMEYVHLKDYRGSGTEPVNVLSRYRFQDGLAYYESTKDTASHFFIDYLPRGTYVFEYSVRVQHRGVYETGIAELQCMYAPEFNSHSGSVEITVE
ncbi:alpha-2-macroglobulin family protein [Mariniblastus fucicola]|uniref:MG2 domain protein n=1 Tax=Mariniblastus fucicola TaxID=980251 RepID=A0A5B9PD35_9BACT|nr:alpha-2-macroglobulin family protein [Mariniblastus fucicola]QEG22990.1 MG2 domain protein [Mariniblastus fucicola]